jgi:hypothetical protein
MPNQSIRLGSPMYSMPVNLDGDPTQAGPPGDEISCMDPSKDA